MSVAPPPDQSPFGRSWDWRTEAVDSLPEDQRLTLFAMSVLAPEHSYFGTSYALRHLADGAKSADGIVGRALARYAAAVPDDTMVRQEVVAAHLHALQGWAKVASALPPTDTKPVDPFAKAWRLVDELLLLLNRGDIDSERVDAIWQQLLTELPGCTLTILGDIYRANIELVNYGDLEHFAPHQALLAAYPDQVRQMLEWSLTHRDELLKEYQWHPMGDLGKYAIRALGQVGTAHTADLLRHHYVHDAELGHDAVAAVLRPGVTGVSRRCVSGGCLQQ